MKPASPEQSADRERDYRKHDRPQSLNPLALYTEAGRKAAIAINQGDWSRSRFHSDWMRQACRLENDSWAKMARETFDHAYKAARKI